MKYPEKSIDRMIENTKKNTRHRSYNEKSNSCVIRILKGGKRKNKNGAEAMFGE